MTKRVVVAATRTVLSESKQLGLAWRSLARWHGGPAFHFLRWTHNKTHPQLERQGQELG
jgi:hypothetical protein